MKNKLKNAELAFENADKLSTKALKKLDNLRDSIDAINVNKKLSKVTIDNITQSKIRSFHRLKLRNKSYDIVSRYFYKDGFYFHAIGDGVFLHKNITLEQFTKLNNRVKIIGGITVHLCFIESPLKLKIGRGFKKPIEFKTVEEMYNFIKEYIL